jgi:hypothetical protein
LINVRFFFQVTVYVDATDAEDFSEVCLKPLKSLPYDSPGQIFVAFEKPEHVLATGKFSNVLKFTVKEVSVTMFLVLLDSGMTNIFCRFHYLKHFMLI